jgi:hypothetical protein
MKTDELIAAMAADTKFVARPIGSTLAIAVGFGALAAALIFFIDFGARPDFAAAIQTPRFVFKYVLTLTLFITALALVLRLARPGPIPRQRLIAMAAAPVLLIIAVVIELLTVPSDEWGVRLVGHNALVCLVLIPALSAIPLAAVLWALRQGAPSYPRLAGAIAGLLSTGIGASLYATHCPDDSPLFLAIWYVIAALIVTGVGASVGARILRW